MRVSDDSYIKWSVPSTKVYLKEKSVTRLTIRQDNEKLCNQFQIDGFEPKPSIMNWE